MTPTAQQRAPEAAGNALDELVRAGTLLSRELEFEPLMRTLVSQALDISRSDLACLYLRTDPDDPDSRLRRAFLRGRHTVPATLDPQTEWVQFVEECEEAALLLEPQPGPFMGLLLHPDMHSGIALPIYTQAAKLGLLVLNARAPLFYNRERFQFLDSFAKLAGGLLHNARLFRELKEYLARIEALERYQQNIFASMTNLLVTTDRRGRLRYFNEAARQRLGLEDEQIGESLEELWRPRLSEQVLNAALADRPVRELLGVEGIYQGPAGDIDFALNVSPLKAPRGGSADLAGTTLVFTDQSREKELQGQMQQVVEERRVIKDMFARYLSNEILQVLMEHPDMINPGGQKMMATVLFADIRGYTSFSEGRAPEEIIQILNEYFSEAVEIIVRQGGFIDKFIGDAIMAAWGVPVSRDSDDTVRAVSAAVEIQRLVSSKQRRFFKGVARDLKIGIGMHTGPLVAGNLGSAQRMDYTVIGDTVNIAARLEGVAAPGEIIITESTRELLAGRFALQEREAVSVKGKVQPIPIYAVEGIAE